MRRYQIQNFHLMIFSYSLSRPLESRQRLYITEASTLAGLNVLGSFSSEITDSSIVLKKNKHLTEISLTINLRYISLYFSNVMSQIQVYKV